MDATNLAPLRTAALRTLTLGPAYAMLLGFSVKEDLLIADQSGLRQGQLRRGYLRALVERNGRSGYAFTATNAAAQTIERAYACAPYGGPAVGVRLPERMPATQALTRSAAVEPHAELLRRVLARLTTAGLSNPRVRLRSARITRVLCDSLGREVVQENLDEIVTLTCGDPAAPVTAQVCPSAVELELAPFIRRAAAVQALPPRLLPEACSLVMTPRVAAAFFHEVVGHSLEADLGGSRLRRQDINIPAELYVTDDPRLGGDRAAYAVDDDGALAQKVVLISAGQVRGRYHSARTAHGYNQPPNGFGRALGALALPAPRQCALSVHPGRGNAATFMADIGDGVLLDGHACGAWWGNSVELTIDSGRIIRHGGAQEFIGRTHLRLGPARALESLRGIGADIEVVDGYSCAKEGSRLPVRFSVPSVLLTLCGEDKQ